MNMTGLLRYDLPPEIIRLWEKRESEALLPLQEMVIKQHDLFGKDNLLVQAPTTSGKTFCGEMAAVQTALRRKKVVYLVPLKALAEEKWTDFREKYEPYGMRVIISTRDRREFDADLESGNFSIAVVVYEKLAQLLVRRPERLREIELVIADELEIMSDPERGGLVEVLLTRILQEDIRLIALSAVIGHAAKLAQWMSGGLVQYERRPVDLRYGVLHEGVFRYRTYNDFAESEEELIDVPSESPWEILAENLVSLAQRGESCIIFVKDKYASRRGAELLAQSADLPAADKALEALRAQETTHSRESLLELLAHGVAFHNADLAPEERRIVEQAFRDGDLRVLVSTSTLAVGMNLPAQNVFITAEKWQYDDRFGMPWKAPIQRGEYENMGGRAGRYGTGADFGRAILVAPTPFDQETLWRRYVEGEREPVAPRLANEPLEDYVLPLIASCACRTLEELVEFFNRTPSGIWVWAETLSIDELDFRVRAAVNRAADAGMLSTTMHGRLEATPFGWAVAAKGISVATAKELAAWVRESETRMWSPLDLVLAATLTPDGRALQIALTTQEYEQAGYPERLRALAKDDDINADVPLNRLRECAVMPFFEEVRAIKTALFLMEWIDERPIYDIEETYHVLLGQILSAAEHFSWLTDATAAIAESFGAKVDFVEAIRSVSERVRRGLSEEALPLARIPSPALGRKAIIGLSASGLIDPPALAAAPTAVLGQHMSTREAKRLKQSAQQMLELGGSKPPPAPRRPAPALIVDDRRPDLITVDGEPVPLQEKQFRLIRVLAGSPGECVPYERIYTEVWGETVVESNQMHFQKRRLLERLRDAGTDRSELIKTIPKRGFLLNLEPDEVVLLGDPVCTAA